MPCRVAWCVLRDEGLDVWRDDERDEWARRFCQLDLVVPMLSLPGVGFSGTSRPSPPWNKITRRMGAG